MGLHQFRHRNSGVYIGHRIVGIAMLYAIRDGQMLKAEAWQTVFIFRPVDTFRAQGIAGAHHIQQVPARIIMLPAPGVRIVKVAVKNITADFIIKTDIVVADDTGFRHREQIVDAAGESGLVVAFGQRFLWRNSGNHHRLWLRQVVVRRLAVEDFRFANDIQIAIGTDGGELRRPVERRAGTEGFVVVEEEGLLFAVSHNGNVIALIIYLIA